jgi:hypothetical protein
MANKIRLRPQCLSAAEYKAIKKPPAGGKFKKVFFQFNLKGFENGDAVFGLIAYGGHRKNGRVFGKPFELHDDPNFSDDVYVAPLAFGNLEVKPTFLKKKKTGKVLLKINNILRSKSKDLKKVMIRFEPMTTKNPHASYRISIDGISEDLNPSPPATPSDF